mmetsp:Transcript_126545/g.354342  ORF Transcript_126545/g.354342 Transcript_126545/m.354342 type:complete len:91 (+) Transcript_126545:189-461(+)
MHTDIKVLTPTERKVNVLKEGRDRFSMVILFKRVHVAIINLQVDSFPRIIYQLVIQIAHRHFRLVCRRSSIDPIQGIDGGPHCHYVCLVK